MQETGGDGGRRHQSYQRCPDLAYSTSRLLPGTQPLDAEIAVFEVAVTAVHACMFFFPMDGAGRKADAIGVALAPAAREARSYVAGASQANNSG